MSIVSKPAYEYNGVEEDEEYILKKLDFTEQEFRLYMESPIRSHVDYPSYERLRIFLSRAKNKVNTSFSHSRFLRSSAGK